MEVEKKEEIGVSSGVVQTSIGDDVVSVPPADSANEVSCEPTEPNNTAEMGTDDDGCDAKDMSVDEDAGNVEEEEPKEANEEPSNKDTDVTPDSSGTTQEPPEVTATTSVPGDTPCVNTSSSNDKDSTDNTPPSTSESPQQSVEDDTNSVYHLKWFDWKGKQTPIVTQNENGPCPLLGIANVLILARKIELPPMQQIISATQLMEYIGDCILSSAPEQDRDNEELILNYQQNMQDAIDIMYKLQTGIDVNVKFYGVCEFEFTRECIVFDLLKIALYHGWLVDPQDAPAVKAIGNLSYNQVVEKLLTSKDSSDDDTISEGLAIEDFLGRTASQLTYHGLCELNDSVQEEELCVFFRNNHFSTLYKHKGELFLLVTDQGFLTEPAVIWETLVNIEGDGQFVNSEFHTVRLQSNSLPPPPTPTNTPASSYAPPPMPKRNLSQEDQDYLLALSLQQERNSPVVQPKNSPPSGQPVTEKNRMESDHALALQLQEDEDRQAALMQQQQHQQQVSSSNRQQPQENSPSQQTGTPQVSSNQRSNQSERGSTPDKCSIL